MVEDWDRDLEVLIPATCMYYCLGKNDSNDTKNIHNDNTIIIIIIIIISITIINKFNDNLI